MPDGLQLLAAEARDDGISNVQALIATWGTGTARFDGPGEALLVAVDDGVGELIGVGGLSACPHLHGALRMRRFYVATAWRRHGVATALATALLSSGFDHVDTITCNARASAAAVSFWEALGFEPTTAEGFTHVLGCHSGPPRHDRTPRPTTMADRS